MFLCHKGAEYFLSSRPGQQLQSPFPRCRCGRQRCRTAATATAPLNTPDQHTFSRSVAASTQIHTQRHLTPLTALQQHSSGRKDTAVTWILLLVLKPDTRSKYSARPGLMAIHWTRTFTTDILACSTKPERQHARRKGKSCHEDAITGTETPHGIKAASCNTGDQVSSFLLIYGNVLRCMAMYCNIRQYTAMYGNVLQ